jgi:hypothetical protein
MIVWLSLYSSFLIKLYGYFSNILSRTITRYLNGEINAHTKGLTAKFVCKTNLRSIENN